MITLYCPEKHENPPGSRFCLHCGAKLALLSNHGNSSRLLGDRYAIISQLGQGGFGRTYLAQDTNRFNELCVLKEFAPQVENADLLKKAEALFKREAGVLHKLQHPQIPSFRELLRANLDGHEYLLLVQDYVEGATYRAVLETRMQQGKQFSEVEVTDLLQQILPVLDYIHNKGVIHRDISPENLILRSSDQLPVLIDFGGVKQVAATVVSQLSSGANKASTTVTLLGKAGYVPQEQMQTGSVYPHSDLYALAATVLVLLTGKEPQELLDDRTLTWKWREISISPALRAVLEKMLSHRSSDRYQSARQVLQALSRNTPAVQSTTRSTQATLAIASPAHSAAIAVAPPLFGQISNGLFTLGKILLVLPILTGAGWLAMHNLLQLSNRTSETANLPSSSLNKSPQFSAAEQKRKQRLQNLRQQLGINYGFHTALVDQAFWEKHPNQRKRSLSLTPEDAALRAEWDTIAQESLNDLQRLRPEVRRQLGRYTVKDRLRWQKTLYKLNLSSHALDDITNAAFFELFPEQQGKNFLNQPIGQVWYGLAAQKVDALTAGTALEKVVFDGGTNYRQLSGSLKPGEGKAYIAELAKDQPLKLELQGNSQVLISVYSPTGKSILIQSSSDRTWSGVLPESGFYEFVLVSTASQTTDYQLNLYYLMHRKMI